MASANIYLIFNGNCEEAFNFYKTVFGGDFPYVGRFKDIPAQEGQPKMSDEDGEKIMHMSLPIGKNSVIMGSDTGGEWSADFSMGNNFSISVNAESRAQADTFFKQLSSGGKITMPIGNTFWGSYFGSFTDKFGINWMISYDEPKK